MVYVWIILAVTIACALSIWVIFPQSDDIRTAVLACVATIVFWVALILALTSPSPTNRIIGDVNNDGIISKLDAEWTSSFILLKRLPTQDQFTAADINKDGVISAADCTIISRKAAADGR